ncbi:MAG: GAF domain-containing protein [Bacteroidales bacterium]|nr:GAF domain-containing protein [Bacteroidales bacterium]MBN2819522.1 GAF domain-containing protein [Bacteroidales bacterium]
MRKIVSLVIVAILFQTIVRATETADIPFAKNGIIDISNRNFDKEYIALSGDWEFFWDTLLTPQQIPEFLSENETAYIHVPASWNTKKGGSYSKKGKATYRLKFKSSGEKKTYAIRLHNFFTSAKVWFDGDLIYQAGKPGFSKKTTKPDYLFQEVPLVFEKDITEHELVIQIANYHHTRSGIVKDLFFGSYNELTHQSKAWLILNLLIIGIILFISFNHLLNFFLYKNEVTNLYFGILCLIMIVRSISTQQRIITFVFPNINWELLFKMDNFSGFGTIPLFAIFLYILFKQDFPRIFLNILVSIGAIITAIVFFTPQIIYGRLRMIFELYVLVGGLSLTFYIILRAAIRKREGALLTFIGFFILYATAINDVLISMGLIHSVEVAPIGLVTYMLVQSFVLSRGSALAIIENKKLGLELQKEKELLENRVAERTKELEERNLEVINQQEAIKHQSWLNDSLARVNVILNEYNKSSIEVLSQNLLSEILDLVNAQVGVVYIINTDDENPVLNLAASKNANAELLSKKTIEPGQGLLGACFLDQKLKTFENVGETYIKLDSGLGEMHLKNIVLLPLETNNIPIGVIEIASFKKLTNDYLELLTKVSESISSTIQFIRLNNKNLFLLEEYKQKQETLDINEMEMLQQLEELQSLKEQMEQMNNKN